MPWSMSDAIHKTKKATTAGDKKAWAMTANHTLAKTGDDVVAIKTANSTIKKRKNGSKIKVPRKSP